MNDATKAIPKSNVMIVAGNFSTCIGGCLIPMKEVFGYGAEDEVRAAAP